MNSEVCDIKDVARLTGVTPSTLRYYDTIGLLKPCARSEAGYRLYGRTELARLREILMWRWLGIPQSDIGALVGAPREIVRKGGVFAKRDLVSAVLFGSGVTPWTLDTAWPSLWENPTPRHRLPDWAFAVAPRVFLADAEEVIATDPGGLVREVLGLPATWPPESFSED